MIDISEEEQLWKLSKYPASFYRLFGFILNHYGGTFNSSHSVLQTFTYALNDLWEKAKADNLAKICTVFFSETNLTDDLNVTTATNEFEQKITLTFISGNICDYLKAIEYDKETELFIPLFKPPFGTIALAKNQRIEFLTGIYLNHHRDEATWIFYNNYQKMILAHQFMVDLAEEEDEIKVTSKFMTPNCHIITLNKDGELWQEIESVIIKRGYQLIQ
ncbi:hypothetical protein [Pedobacter frigiditerrae]|uniref:hypothetical protein n=1 Tax=Pedobacter frigiditerrae TaxID=2530452 RepID=UPI00292EDC98|nr:hypothetical protein [Pedobacter frigiditerrae]